MEALAEAETNRTRLARQAEAEAALAKGKAETEAKQKTANAFKGYDEAAVLSMIIDTLLQLMREATQPLGNIEKISVVDTGSSLGETSEANRVTNYATNLLSSTQETLKATTEPDLKEAVENLSARRITSQVNTCEVSKEVEQNSMREE